MITGLQIKNQATGKICYSWGTINEEAPDKPEQPDDEPPTTKPIVPETNGTVEASDKLPENAKIDKEIMVANYIRNEISDIQERMNLKTYQEARKRVFDFADTLITSGAIQAFDWKTITMNEAKNLFKAIKDFLPDGDAA